MSLVTIFIPILLILVNLQQITKSYPTVLEMNQSDFQIHYNKKIGAYRPTFEGKPESYYTLTNFDIFCGLFSCFAVIILTFWIAVGLYFWSYRVSTSNLITVWSIILIVFILFFMVAAFCLSKGKAEIQEQLIKKALQKQKNKKEPKQFQLTKMKLKDGYTVYENNLTQEVIIQK